MKVGIYIRNKESFWYIFASDGNNNIKYLHKDSLWRDSCYNYLVDKNQDMFQGHYASQEEAIEYIKKHTHFKHIFINEEPYEVP